MTRTLEILDRLVAFPSVSSESNLGIVEYCEDLLRAVGFSVHRVTDPTGRKAGLFASLGPGDGGILLSGHTDVVPVAGQAWTRDPFRLTREGDRLFGRGTTDMKGFVASVLALAERAARAPLNRPLKIALSYDEEVGCVGIRHMIGDLGPSIGAADLCIVGEPTEMQVAVGHKGKVALKAVFLGQNGHSALAPKFVNALHLAADFISEMRALQDDIAANGARDPAYDIPYTTVHVGRLSGGTALNIVPDRAEAEFEFRHLAADRPEDLTARIEARARAVAARHGAFEGKAAIEITQVNAYPGLAADPASPAVTMAQALALTNGTTKVAFGTEAGFFAALGIPTLVCGPGSMEGQGHKPDEFLTLGQLAACDAMMERVLNDLCR